MTAVLVALAASGCAADAANPGRSSTVAPVVAPAPSQPAARPTATPEVTVEQEQSFHDWLTAFRQEAREKGITEQTIERSLRSVRLQPRVLELDRAQPEFAQTVWTYLRRGVNDQRVAQGREMLKKHGPLLTRVEARYGVPARYLVAFWGMETNFGATFGGFPVLDALATLAYDARRAQFFRKELLDALLIVQAGHIAPEKMIGSWAGAMGHMQFMPSTFRNYAVDGDGDGRIDVWGSLPDAFSSAANYLSRVGWKAEQGWGMQVVPAPGLDPALADAAIRKPAVEWQSLGVRPLTGTGGRGLSGAGDDLSLALPAGVGGPAFLTGANFRTIMVWNRSVLYALAVGTLADRITGGPAPDLASYPEQRALSRTEMMEMQTLLAGLGYDAGAADGVIGARSRAALKAFQVARGRPADAHPDADELEALRQAAAGQ